MTTRFTIWGLLILLVVVLVAANASKRFAQVVVYIEILILVALLFLNYRQVGQWLFQSGQGVAQP